MIYQLILKPIGRLIMAIWHVFDPEHKVADGIDQRTGSVDFWTWFLVALAAFGVVGFLIVLLVSS